MTSNERGRGRPNDGRACEAQGGASPSLPIGREQAMLDAADPATLYSHVRQDAAHLARVEAQLRDLARISLILVEAASAEAAALRLATELSATIGASRAGVFALRNGRYRLLSSIGEAPGQSSMTQAEVGCLGERPVMRSDHAWTELRLGEPVLVVPFPGRGKNVVGFAVVEAATPGDETQNALELLARFAGVLLESHLIEEARLEARRSTCFPSGGTARDGAVAGLIGDSVPMKQVRRLVRQVAPVTSPVLILGETGTGKELVARAIHAASPRRNGPFVALNCGALPENLVESEFFGHEAGAFTGAQKKHRGKIELAHGGTLFLDELGEMPKAAQVKLLRFLQDSRYVPLGGETERRADVRLLAATSKRLDAAIAAGEIREDLLFRLNVFTVVLPPLRDRGYDVVSLAKGFIREFAERVGRAAPELMPSAQDALLAYHWPGNVRELRNVIERTVILSTSDSVDATLLHVKPTGSRAATRRANITTAGPGEANASTSSSSGAVAVPTAEVLFAGDVLRPFADAKEECLARFEARYCEAVLSKTGGNVAKAARLANMDKKNLHRKLRSYGLVMTGHNGERSRFFGAVPPSAASRWIVRNG